MLVATVGKEPIELSVNTKVTISALYVVIVSIDKIVAVIVRMVWYEF